MATYYDALAQALQGYNSSNGIGSIATAAESAATRGDESDKAYWSNLLAQLVNNQQSTGTQLANILASGQNAGEGVRIINSGGAYQDDTYKNQLAQLALQMQQERGTEQNASDARYNELVGANTGYNAQIADIGGRYDSLGQGYAGRMNEIGTRYDQVTNAYANRMNSLNTLLNDMGAQARTDIQGRYNQAAAKADQGLTSRGLANSTVRTNAQAGIGNQQAAELRRHDEGMRQQKFDALLGMTGDTLNAQSQAAGARGALYGDYLGSIGQGIQARQDLSGQRLQTIKDRNVNYASLGDLMNSLTLNAANQEQRFSFPQFGSQRGYR